METRSGRRLGKTVDAIEWAELELAQKPVGWLFAIGDIQLWKALDGIHAFDKENNLEAVGGGIMDVMTKLAKLEDAIITVVQNGNAYRVGPTRITLHVWNKDYTKLDTLKEVFGGNHYPHGSGSLWICSKRDVLMEIWDKVKDHDTDNRLIELEEWYDENSG